MEEQSKKNQSIEELIYNETKNRLAIMEKPDYEFPESITKVDVIAIVAGIVISLLLIALCMMGVIQ
jgi:sensor c-di-GMP phosphodiesterase-like protein